MSIHWSAFDWGSFSTLTTGLIAVIAALIVGWRQSGISARQTKLLEHQALIEEMGIRHQLFERRYKIYEPTRAVLLHLLQYASQPTPDLQTAFLRAKLEARFLFRQDLCDYLDDLWKRMLDYSLLKTDMARLFEDSGHYGDGNPKREREFYERFSDDLGKLSDVFGVEMKLSHHGQTQIAPAP